MAGLALSFGASAQLTSKKGEMILPEEGDWSLGFSANPFLNYAGNFFSQAGNTAPTANAIFGDMTITGKYFVSENFAYRGRARLGLTSNKFNTVTNEGTVDNPDIKVDQTTVNNTNIVIGGGVEHRHGTTRIQGYCGADGLIRLTDSKTSIDYESTLTGAQRTTEVNTGMGFGLTARGFAGVEIFVFPKTSIGFEYGWGLGFFTGGDTETTYELQNGETTTNQTGAGGSSFGVDNDVTGGNISINFFF